LFNVTTAKDWFAEKGYDPVFGAWLLKRFLQRRLGTKLARSRIAGEVAEGSERYLHCSDDRLEAVQQKAAKRRV